MQCSAGPITILSIYKEKTYDINIRVIRQYGQQRRRGSSASITKQVKELSDNQELTDEQKSEMEQMYQSQTAMLEAQIAQLEQKQAQQKSEPAQQATQVKAADGINCPTETNQLNVYI
ncbi:FlxA|nr:FlxA [Candidatus Pantoea persica]